MKNNIKIQLFLCYVLLSCSNMTFAQVEVLQKEVIFVRPYELFFPSYNTLDIVVFHNMFLVYNEKNFNWVTAVDSGVFIADYNFYDYHGFSIKYYEAIRKETDKPNNSLDLLIDVEKNHPNVYNWMEIKASRYWKKYNQVNKPSFELFKATIDYILLGEEKIWIPNFSYRGCINQKVAYHVSCKVYAIVNVTAFEPISEEDADLWLKK